MKVAGYYVSEDNGVFSKGGRCRFFLEIIMCPGIECMDCLVKRQLDRDGFVGTCAVNVICQIMESIGSVRHGSVEIKIQDSKVVQIDTLDKKRLTGS